MSYSEKWISILNQVKDFSGGKGLVYFRGHSECEYKLNSGLFRESGNSITDYLASENVKYYRFLTLGYLDHKETNWNLLYLMQHHGVRTRLLDWSESFVTALFFAYMNWDPLKKSACIWMLDPSAQNKKALGSPGLINPNNLGNYEGFLTKEGGFAEYSVALLPSRNSKRMVAQQGVFTLQGNSLTPLDQEFNGDLIREGSLVNIVLDFDLVEDIRAFLLQTGVNYYSLFPDLEGLAKFVNDPLLVPQNILKLYQVSSGINEFLLEMRGESS